MHRSTKQKAWQKQYISWFLAIAQGICQLFLKKLQAKTTISKYKPWRIFTGKEQVIKLSYYYLKILWERTKTCISDTVSRYYVNPFMYFFTFQANHHSSYQWLVPTSITTINLISQHVKTCLLILILPTIVWWSQLLCICHNLGHTKEPDPGLSATRTSAFRDPPVPPLLMLLPLPPPHTAPHHRHPKVDQRVKRSFLKTPATT